MIMNTTFFWNGFRAELAGLPKLATVFPLVKSKTNKTKVLGNNKPETTSHQRDIPDHAVATKPLKV